MSKKKKSKKNKKKTPQSRDLNIQKHLEGEINLGTKVIPDKKKYNRKEKHKHKKYE